MKKQSTKLLDIKNRFGDNLELSKLQNTLNVLKEKEITNERRQTKMMNALQMKNMLRKGATAIWFREQIGNNFNEPTADEVARLENMHRAIEYEKDKQDAM